MLLNGMMMAEPASAIEPDNPRNSEKTAAASRKVNVPAPTFGGTQFWGDVRFFRGWRIRGWRVLLVEQHCTDRRLARRTVPRPDRRRPPRSDAAHRTAAHACAAQSVCYRELALPTGHRV